MDAPARDFYRRALKERPNAFRTLLMLTRLDLRSKGKSPVLWREAKRCARRIAILRPSSPLGWGLLADAYFSKGETRAGMLTLALGHRQISSAPESDDGRTVQSFRIEDVRYGH